MRGEKYSQSRRSCALHWASFALGGACVLGAVPGMMENLWAAETRTDQPVSKQACCERSIVVTPGSTEFDPVDKTAWVNDVQGDCLQQCPTEKSIVVAVREDAHDAVVSEQAAASGLAPISNISPQVPELADPQSIARVPDLAKPIEKVAELEQAQPDTSEASSAVELSGQPPEVFTFQGVSPGISVRSDVLTHWGDSRSGDHTASNLTYDFDRLRSVQVHFKGDLVETILVQLEKPVAIELLTKKLHLHRARPAQLADESGSLFAQVFPERGVVLKFLEEKQLTVVTDTAGDLVAGMLVDEIVIKPLQAASFLLRAEQTSWTHLSDTISDLEEALRYDRTSVRARWLLSEINLNIGEALAAEQLAAEATEIEPQNHEVRLQWAKCLRQLARYDRAVEETRTVLNSADIPAITRAQALHEMGRLTSLGSNDIAERAVPLHTKSIEIADQLAVEGALKDRQSARELLLEAHLAMAVEIAQGHWRLKDQTVPKWIERASALAEDMIADDPAYLALRLKVATTALTAAASLEYPINPLLWVEEAEQTVRELGKATKDELTIDQYFWQMGLVYFHAAQIEHRRSESESAKQMCELAEMAFGDLAEQRDQLPDTAYLLGKIYFQMGAIHAVLDDNHHVACQWYDQAAELLLTPAPVTTMVSPQQQGDALVSMGVSYWETDRHDRAIEFTEAGAELLEQAVESNLLKSVALIVPYRNLSAMYEANGKSEPAARYSRLVKQITEKKLSQKPTPKHRS